MFKIRKRFAVFANQQGYLFKNHRLHRQLKPGIFQFVDWGKRLSLVSLPTVPRTITVLNQDVLTQDNISLRFSYFLTYSVVDGEKLLGSIDLSVPERINGHIEQILHASSQVALRESIAQVPSEEMNQQREKILETATPRINKEVELAGLRLDKLSLRDITYPKNIQDLFSKKLEAQIRAQADLENARSQVAAARALKNAASLMKDDDNIRFLQWLETISRIASKGKHVFHIGEVKNDL